MPDEYDDEADDDVEQESSVLRELRKKAKRADEAEAKAHALERENALIKANLGLTPAQEEALLAVHKGDMTPEALQATRASLYGAASDEAEAPQVPADEQAAHERMAAATAAAAPAEAQVKTLNDEIAAAQSAEELTAILRREGMLAGEQ